MELCSTNHFTVENVYLFTSDGIHKDRHGINNFQTTVRQDVEFFPKLTFYVKCGITENITC